MPGLHVYEYAVIRVVPVLTREEFLNVGIILFSKHARYIKVHIELDPERAACFRWDADPEDVRSNLCAFERIAHGDPTGGPIAALDIPSRFRWLTAVRSSAIQTSRPHPGKCDDLDHTVQRLFEELIR